MNYLNEYKKWLLSNRVTEEEKEILKNLNEEEIKESFDGFLEFGTAGLRGIMAPGTNNMNNLVVAKATFGYGRFLNNKFEGEKAVVIGYDCRNNSKEFALVAAKALGSLKIKSYLFSSLRPTPEVSYAIRLLKAQGGINITASHNPKEYNGFKVYLDDGSQLLPDDCEKVEKEISKLDILNLPFKRDCRKYIEEIDSQVDDSYIDRIVKELINPNLIKEKSEDIKILYTPFHGAGSAVIEEAFNKAGFKNVTYVKKQMEVDGNFKTCLTPNPENIKSFEFTLKKAEGHDIILATDPDADRVAAMALHKGKYEFITGNQMGALITKYLFDNKKDDGKTPVIIKSLVSSNLPAQIAKDYNAKVINTLTGFKYIGFEMNKLENSSTHKFLFGFEESIGYLVGDYARDKDSIVTTLIISEMALFYKKQNKTLIDVLEEIYLKYGFFIEKTLNLEFKGLKGKEEMDDTMRNISENPENVIKNLKIVKVLDFKKSIIKNLEKNKEEILDYEKANVIAIELEEKNTIIIRPSGTEPKIKVYILVKGKTKKEAVTLVRQIEKSFIK